MKNTINSFIRFYKQLGRPSKKKNLRLLNQRGETTESLNIREAMPADISRLAALHVISWNETYSNTRNPPVYETRERQWKQQFDANDNNWFCYVAENSKGELVGFVKGVIYSHSDLPDYSGQLQHIYLLRTYQRIGIGKKLFCKAAEKFLSMGINAIVLFGIPQNPSVAFYEAMGGRRLYDKQGVFQGGYGWASLSKITSLCKQ